MTTVYYFIDHTGLLACNILIGILLLFLTGAIATFIFSIVYAGILVPLSFLFWFRPGYKAFRLVLKNQIFFTYLIIYLFI